MRANGTGGGGAGLEGKGTEEGKVRVEIVDGLCQNAGPVDGVDGAKMVTRVEGNVVKELFDNVLMV